MTTIATVEELHTVPEGSSIRIIDPRNGTKTWTKAGEQFVLDGMTITEDMLAAALAANAVESGPIFAAGQVFALNSYEYFVLRVREDDSADVLGVYDRASVEGLIHWTEPISVPPITEALDERQRALVSAGNAMLREQGRAATANSQAAANLESLRSTNRDINSSIIDALGNFDDDDDRGRMVEVLRAYGWEVPTRNVRYQIRVAVSTEGEGSLGDSEARVVIGDSGDACVIDDTEAIVRWTHTIEFTDEYDGENSDACEDRELINNEWCEDRLREAGFNVTNVDEIQSRSCSECG